MSDKLMPIKGVNTCHYSKMEHDKFYSTENISDEGLNAYQRRQINHDYVYHHEICVLDISRRMNHVTLHLAKYLNPLSSLPISEPENNKAFIDSFIMIVSASTLLNISLVEELRIEEENRRSFIENYIQLLSSLAKACEATDHQEDYPIRVVWNKTIRKFFRLLVHEATSRNISLLTEANRRLDCVESNHPLNNILQG